MERHYNEFVIMSIDCDYSMKVQVELDSLPQMLSSITSVGFIVMKNESDDEEKKIPSSS